VPAMPIAPSKRAPIVVGMSATSREVSVVVDTVCARSRRTAQRDHAGEEDQRQAGEQDAETDLVGRLAPVGALDERDHAVEENSARALE
jgi:hypothetical protein